MVFALFVADFSEGTPPKLLLFLIPPKTTKGDFRLFRDFGWFSGMFDRCCLVLTNLLPFVMPF